MAAIFVEGKVEFAYGTLGAAKRLPILSDV